MFRNPHNSLESRDINYGMEERNGTNDNSITINYKANHGGTVTGRLWECRCNWMPSASRDLACFPFRGAADGLISTARFKFQFMRKRSSSMEFLCFYIFFFSRSQAKQNKKHQRDRRVTSRKRQFFNWCRSSFPSQLFAIFLQQRRRVDDEIESWTSKSYRETRKPL